MEKQLGNVTFNPYIKSETLKKIITLVRDERRCHILATGLINSALSFAASRLFKETKKTCILIADTKEEAIYFFNDLERIIKPDELFFYPDPYYQSRRNEETDATNMMLRAEVLNRIGRDEKPLFVVTCPDALFEKVVTRKELEKKTLKIELSDTLSTEFINDILFEYDFDRVDFVTEPGEFSVRGGIIDVFSYSNELPYRIEFFGDEVDSIRTFDIETQLSIEKIQKASIIPNIENKKERESRESFLEYIAPQSIIILKNKDVLMDRLDNLFLKAQESTDTSDKITEPVDLNTLFCDGTSLQEQLLKFTFLQLEGKAFHPSKTDRTKRFEYSFDFDIAPQPSFNKQFGLLIENLQQNSAKGYTNYLLCSNEKQVQRFHDIFDDIAREAHYRALVLPMYQGFVDHNIRIACYTDHQIFERYHKFRLKKAYSKKQAVVLKELSNFEMGDYVTHIDHGIGKFGGLQKIEVGGKKQEAIKLIYSGDGVLYVSIHALHKISKFNSKDGKAPKINKLGSHAWKNLKNKTKRKVREIAFDLIQLYAERRAKKGFQYSPDSYLQHELEASFMYEDTPDQLKATREVKADMEREMPMDRLVCGDVGFGKTEVIIRAAFKAVDNSKQVAVLVPTTILAFQHFKTFSERLKELPVTIDYLNRFRTAKQRSAIITKLQEGKIDILIGTHQIVSKTLNFKDLGLLIIDEEQKFGVAVKDKLKRLKPDIDTLTLTATPIPRTLQFSLMAARDLSVINTPPPNRYPVETHIIGFDKTLIHDAITYELSRGGQVFFIHNRVENIQEVATMIQRIVPKAKIGIGHGQMQGKKLEALMLDFMEGAFDLLVATTIVENGLDIPNANTIFINNASNFGLSDLHQMRGRVGRSNKRSFCYFITPPREAMSQEAQKRITAIEQFSGPGSGFNIAMKDLEIRGSGDLLGGEQSGFINEMGFDAYQKILDETIEELKEGTFKELYQTEKKDVFVKDTQIDTDFEILLPDDYVDSISERLNLYSELNGVKNEEELLGFEQKLIDRFGALPKQAKDLLNSVRCKWIAKEAGFEKLVMKNNRLIGYFVSEKQSEYYQSELFTRILHFVRQHPEKTRMKEKQTADGLRLLLYFDEITSIETALKTIENLSKAS